MPKKNLTEKAVRKLKPPAQGKQVDYFDAGMPGLVLRVNYGGRKAWRALYYVKGTHKQTDAPRTENASARSISDPESEGGAGGSP